MLNNGGPLRDFTQPCCGHSSRIQRSTGSPHQVGAHVRLHHDLLLEGELGVQGGLALLPLDPLVAAFLEPEGEEGLQELVQDLGRYQQRGETL